MLYRLTGSWMYKHFRMLHFCSLNTYRGITYGRANEGDVYGLTLKDICSAWYFYKIPVLSDKGHFRSRLIRISVTRKIKKNILKLTYKVYTLDLSAVVYPGFRKLPEVARMFTNTACNIEADICSGKVWRSLTSKHIQPRARCNTGFRPFHT